MEDRITLSLIYMGLVSALLAVILTTFTFHSSLQDQAAAGLMEQTQLIADVCTPADEAQALARLDTAQQRCLMLVSADGALLYGPDGTDAGAVLAQPEVQQALQSGSGSDRRTEGGAVMEFCALKLESGSILCVSNAAPSTWVSLSSYFGYLIIIFLILIPLSFLFSLLMTHRLLRPIKALPQQLARPDFDPERAAVYPELQPLVAEITERRNEREAMRQEFTANVSHELKTPLTTISGYSEMIAGGLAKPEDIPRFAEKIRAESERMQTLVGDIIELNALDSEVVHQHGETVDVLSLVQDCVEQLAPHFSAKHLSVYITGDGFSVSGSRRQLWELVYNLLDNARRYNVDGGMIRISVSGGTLSVRDTGIGIAQEHQGRVFERFYRVDKSHSRATGGTGLGLSIVKHVAELHGAAIELESTEHIGTEIRIRFPS